VPECRATFLASRCLGRRQAQEWARRVNAGRTSCSGRDWFCTTMIHAIAGGKLKWFGLKDRTQSANAGHDKCGSGSTSSLATESRGAPATRSPHQPTAHARISDRADRGPPDARPRGGAPEARGPPGQLDQAAAGRRAAVPGGQQDHGGVPLDMRSNSRADLTLLSGVPMFGLAAMEQVLFQRVTALQHDDLPNRNARFVEETFDAPRVCLSKLQLPIGRLSPDSGRPRTRRLSRLRNGSRQHVAVPAVGRGAGPSQRHDHHGLLKLRVMNTHWV
jgi:hypothetical protein